MPYIQINIAKALNDAQKDQIKTGLGQNIALIPGKSEGTLMVDISDQHTIYLAGEKKETAFIDVRIYSTTTEEYKKSFTEAAFQTIAQATGIPQDAMYLTFSEFPNWGTKGSYK